MKYKFEPNITYNSKIFIKNYILLFRPWFLPFWITTNLTVNTKEECEEVLKHLKK